jgi:hypothetical protein
LCYLPDLRRPLFDPSKPRLLLRLQTSAARPKGKTKPEMSLEVETTLDGDVAAVLSLDRQIPFAAATTATAIAKRGQEEAIAEIRSDFTTTNPWYLPTNFFGVHFTPATVANPQSQVHTNAWWLKDHETGALRTPRDGTFLAVPTEAIQPNRRQAIPQNQRPKNLADAFILRTQRGPKLFERINGRLQAVYNLVRNVRIEKRSTIVEPTVRVADKEFAPTFYTKLLEAIKTAK